MLIRANESDGINVEKLGGIEEEKRVMAKEYSELAEDYQIEDSEWGDLCYCTDTEARLYTGDTSYLWKVVAE